jgi:small basic protein (TIGR04137 family)
LDGFDFEETMSLDKSLKKAGSLARSRNVLTRAERLALLQEDERWKPAAGVYNLPKTKFRRLAPGQSGPKRPDGSA